MKAIAKFETAARAELALDALSLRGIYGCLSGCKSRGYEVLVREAVQGTANDALKAFKLSPEVTTK